MKSFEYILTLPGGFEAYPLRALNHQARRYDSAVIIHTGTKSANVLRLTSMMQLNTKCGDTVKVTIEGGDEDVVAPIVEEFFKNNF